MNPIPIKSPEVKGAITRAKAKLAVADEERRAAHASTASFRPSPKQPALPPKPPTRTQRLNQLVADHTQQALDARGEVSIPDLDAQITAALVQAMMERPDEMLAVAEAAIRPTIHAIVTRTLAKNGVQIQGEHAVSMEALRAKVKIRSEAVRWLEWDPTAKVYVPLHEMTRRQLMDAALTHSHESRDHSEIARWFLNMADRMDDAELTVGQAFDDNEIIRLRGLAASPSPVGHQDRG